jgi:hypothetical protein
MAFRPVAFQPALAVKFAVTLQIAVAVSLSFCACYIVVVTMPLFFL